MSFSVRIATPDKTYYEGDADVLVGPGLDGYFGILTQHVPMLSGMGTGILRVVAAGESRLFVMDGGAAEVTGTRVIILADQVEEARTPAEAEQRLVEIMGERLETRRAY